TFPAVMTHARYSPKGHRGEPSTRFPAMAGEKLHAFDLELTWYVLDNVRARREDPAFAAFLDEQLDAPVLAYLTALANDDEPPALLLSDAELENLTITFMNGVPEFDHRWEP